MRKDVLGARVVTHPGASKAKRFTALDRLSSSLPGQVQPARRYTVATIKGCVSDWENFSDYCGRPDHSPLPPHQLPVALYIADLTGRWLWSQPSTVTTDSLPLAI
jgi:hypothetical protein